MQRSDENHDELIDLGEVIVETKGGIVGFEDNAGTQQLDAGLADD